MAAQDVQDLRVHAHAQPQRLAIRCGESVYSYGDLEALANRIAHGLRRRGLQRGDHVAALLGNRAEMLALAWAAWRAGLYLTPMATSLAATELQYLVQDSGARLVVSEPAFEPLRHLLPGFTLCDELHAHEPVEPIPDESPGALMMYTSGTTGQPKGVIRPLLPADWRGTPPFAADLLALFGIGGHGVRYLSTAPLYHAAPLRFALAVTAGGGQAHVMDRFDAGEALRLLAQRGITHSQWVPAMFQRLVSLPAEERAAFAAPSHRCAIHGAAPCPPELKQAMIDWWGPILLEYYSGSEGVGLTMIDSHEALARPGSVGRARKGRVRIIDEAGHEVPAGVTGRIYFSEGPRFAYHNAPEKTAQRLTPEGWQTFGDIGHVDTQGYLYLTDRQDDMIISGGVNVYPQEIEAVVRKAEGIWDCAVIGVPHERFGEAPAACVVLKRNADREAALDAAKSMCASMLGRYKQPVRWVILEDFPRSPTGKLLRRELRTHLAS